jgi:hypothetical protein
MWMIVGALSRWRAACVIAAAACVAMSAVHAQDPQLPRLDTNEAFVEEAGRTSAVAIKDPMAVFTYVLGSLPERVRVYPTENHYYFSFTHNGARFAGNIKIDARLRDEGRATFVYYREQPPEREDAPDKELMLDAARGVAVEKVESLAYRISYGAKSVVFALNDLSQVRPPAQTLAPDEQFIGPVFDESALRFFLLFNGKLKLFIYVLDETVKTADTLVPDARHDRILIGRRSGFAFYRDHKRDRKILIGAVAANVRANNYFDGPFDQLPDNFIQDEALRQAIVAVAPDLKGKIDRFGAMADGARYAIVPYMHYRTPRDLDVFHRCAMDRRIPASQYYKCFVIAPDEINGPKARPLAMRRNAR